jgi:hypothetical protein
MVDIKVPIIPVKDIFILPGVSEQKIAMTIIFYAELVIVHHIPVAPVIFIGCYKREPVCVVIPVFPEHLVHGIFVQMAGVCWERSGERGVIPIYTVEKLIRVPPG